MILAAGIYALSVLVLTIYGINLLWMAATFARSDRRKEGPVPHPETFADLKGELPHVTVQLPLYNESLVAERLIDACAGLNYPLRQLEIQVLDDSTDETSAIVAARVKYWRRRGIDIVHIQRRVRDGYKAGALQNGLLLARGDYIAVFDADFVPRPDFLRRILAEFSEPRTGMVQARWTHLNAASSLLTRIQATGLDAHFALEQRVRNLAGCFMNFNGTAGVWRRSCIEEAGGWEGDTIAEDLDLSYRAQIEGWQFKYVGDIEVPAELPVTTEALRSQQFRWAKGSVETAIKLLGRLWRSENEPRVKVQGTIHLTSHLVYPFLLAALFLHAPMVLAKHAGAGPGDVYFGLMALGLTGFVGFSLAQLFAQRDLYPDWGVRFRFVPVFMAGTIGLALSNTQAVLEALAGKRTPFIRTPKFNLGGDGASPNIGSMAAILPHGVPKIAFAEFLIFAYSAAGLAAIIAAGAWAAVPFQALFVAGFCIICMANFTPAALHTSPAHVA